MLIDLNEKFLKQKVEMGKMEACFDLYEYYQSKNDNRKYDPGLWYLKQFLIRLHPYDSMKIFAKKEGRQFTKQGMQEDYIHLMLLVAAVHYDCSEFDLGILWARKAMDMFDFFYAKYNEPTKEKLKSGNSDFKRASYMFNYYKEYFDEKEYIELKGIPFDWEDKCYFSKIPSNDNIKK